MLKQIYAPGPYLIAANSNIGTPYINMSNPSAGMLRYNGNGNQLEVYDGSSWLSMNTNTATVDLTQEAREAIAWASKKRQEELDLLELAQRHPAVQDALNKLRANGLTFGLDYKLDDAAIVGGAIGIGNGWINDNSSGSNIKSNQLTFTGYGMVALDGTWVVDAMAGYGKLDISGIRTTSDGAAVLSMNRRGDTFFSSVSINKLFWVGGLKISPFIREDWVKINLDGYSESGSSDYALGYESTSYITTKSSAGLNISHDAYLERGKLTTSAKFALNVAKTGDIRQNIFYADTGSDGGVSTLSQLATNQVSQSLGLSLLYTQKSGDSFDLSFTQAVGANQFKQSSFRFTLRFAM